MGEDGAQQRLRARMVEVLLDMPSVVDRHARALLLDLLGDMLGERVFLREQQTAQLYAIEIVRHCASRPDGLGALSATLRLLEGETVTARTFAGLVGEWESGDRATPDEHDGPPRSEHRQEGESATEPRLRDFFVSYTSADHAWATWIAWELEYAGFTVLLQEWDFVPGTNWHFAMDRGVTECERIIAVLSPAYLRSAYGRLESHVAQGEDPTGLSRRLIPVRVAPGPISGLLSGVVYIDLVGLPSKDARERLLTGIGTTRSGRNKPAVPPRFPGESSMR